MLPACRTQGKAEAPPPCALAQGDVEGFLHAWRGFHDAFRACFPRREPREHCFRDLVGQLRPLERQSIEPMALEAERRTTCQVPENRAFQTKPQLAGAMVRALFQKGVLPFRDAVADGLDGNRADVLAAVEACWGVTYLVGIPADTRGWRDGPVMETHASRDRGKARTTRVMTPKDSHPPTAEQIAKRLPETCWYRRPVAEGTKGPIIDECTTRQVTRCHAGMPGRAVWLGLKRTVGAAPSYSY